MRKFENVKIGKLENEKGCHRFYFFSVTAIKEGFLFAPLSKAIVACEGDY